MVEVITYGEVDWVLAQEITERLAARNVTATPFGGGTDHTLTADSVQVVGTGGTERFVAVADAAFDIDVRAATEGDALRLASLAHGVAVAIGRGGLVRGGVTIVNARPVAIPYLNPDPVHPSLVRVTSKIVFVVKGTAV